MSENFTVTFFDNLPQKDMDLLESYGLIGCVCVTIVFLIHKMIFGILNYQGMKVPSAEPTVLTEVLTIAERNLIGFILTFLLYIGLKFYEIECYSVLFLMIAMLIPLRMYTETIIITMAIVSILTKFLEDTKNALRSVMMVVAMFVILKDVIMVFWLLMSFALKMDSTDKIMQWYFGIYLSTQLLLNLPVGVKFLPANLTTKESCSMGKVVKNQVNFLILLKLVGFLSLIYLGGNSVTIFAGLIIMDIFLLPITIRYWEIITFIKSGIQGDIKVEDSAMEIELYI